MLKNKTRKIKRHYSTKTRFSTFYYPTNALYSLVRSAI